MIASVYAGPEIYKAYQREEYDLIDSIHALAFLFTMMNFLTHTVMVPRPTEYNISLSMSLSDLTVT